MALAAALSTSGASVASRSHVMYEARSVLGGVALPACLRKHAFTTDVHCELGRQRVVSSIGWNTYGVSLPAESYSSSMSHSVSGSVSRVDMVVMLGP